MKCNELFMAGQLDSYFWPPPLPYAPPGPGVRMNGRALGTRAGCQGPLGHIGVYPRLLLRAARCQVPPCPRIQGHVGDHDTPLLLHSMDHLVVTEVIGIIYMPYHFGYHHPLCHPAAGNLGNIKQVNFQIYYYLIDF